MERETPSERIRAHRERVGLSGTAIAEALGLTVQSYWDLERHQDEAFTSVSLAQLQALARLLETTIADLVGEQPVPNRPPVQLSQIAGRIRAHIESTGTSVESFEDRVGWVVAQALQSPESIWNWNLDQLRDVCAEIGVDWQEMLPA